MGYINFSNGFGGFEQRREKVDLSLKFEKEILYSEGANAWSWIKSRISSGDYSGIQIGDYIPMTTSEGYTLKMAVAGIDTYTYNGFPTMIGHHIDFISEDLFPISHKFNLAAYSNGNHPKQTFSGDGSTVAFALPSGYVMESIASVKVDGITTSNYTYESGVITFASAPASGTNNIVVTGTGSDLSWLVSDLYAYVNSIKMHVPNGTTVNPSISIVDYTQSGVYNTFPNNVKAVIKSKRLNVPTRYQASNLLSSDNSWEWLDIGKVWLPFDAEIYGYPVHSNMRVYSSGFCQYPIFCASGERSKFLSGATRTMANRVDWWTATPTNAIDKIMQMRSSGVTYPESPTTESYFPICFRVEE